MGLKRLADGTMHMYINGEDMGVAATNIPRVSFEYYRALYNYAIQVLVGILFSL